MLTHQGTAVLHTKNLLLRPYLKGDEQAMYQNWAADEEVCRYLTWAPHESLESTRQIVSEWASCYGSDTFYHWGITLDGLLIGDIAVVNWNEASEWAEIGYCLGRPWWGQGIMTEALQSVMRYLFESVGFHRISLRHLAQNTASGRVMQKAGLQYEGTMRDAIKHRDGRFADLCLYGALNGEWQAAQRRTTT
jgi:ribosomal-protein-alanine N-acetyltransferase